MKKIVLALAVVFSVALVSCGNKNAEAVDSDTVTVEEVEVVENDTLGDTVVSDTVVAAEVAVDSAK